MKALEINNRFAKYRSYGYPVLAVLLYLMFALINPLEGFFASYAAYTWVDYLIEVGYLLFFTIFTIESGIATTRLLDAYSPWQYRPLRRFGLQLFLQIVALSTLFVLLEFSVRQLPTSFIVLEEALLIRQAIVLGVLVSILITAFFTAEYFLLNWNKARLQAELLEKKALQAELAALRTQIDPHFLFNNFSTLTALIEDAPDKALTYLEKLSSVYRYLLTFRNKQVASLLDESLFIEAYLYLFQVRYGQNLQVLMQLEEALLDKKIPPLSLQLLVENAVKHNSISASEPLSIKIYISEQQFLVVENNRNPKITPEESTGLGLQNIAQRYELLGLPDAVMVHQTAHIFQVTIPLIEDEN